jgi:gamma-glutamyl-gamma-aminobutyrate hydrolase PuuD
MIEALEAADPSRWVFGVQWHPENLADLKGPAGDASRDLFSAFVEAAKHGQD